MWDSPHYVRARYIYSFICVQDQKCLSRGFYLACSQVIRLAFTRKREDPLSDFKIECFFCCCCCFSFCFCLCCCVQFVCVCVCGGQLVQEHISLKKKSRGIFVKQASLWSGYLNWTLNNAKIIGGTFVTCTEVNFKGFKNAVHLPAWKRGYIS